MKEYTDTGRIYDGTVAVSTEKYVAQLKYIGDMVDGKPVMHAYLGVYYDDGKERISNIKEEYDCVSNIEAFYTGKDYNRAICEILDIMDSNERICDADTKTAFYLALGHTEILEAEEDHER